MMPEILYIILPLLLGWVADRLLGDPRWLPHPVIAMGKIIAWGEKILNKGNLRKVKGTFFSIILIILSFLLIYFIEKYLNLYNRYLGIFFSATIVFFCLAGKTLILEVRNVFIALDISLTNGRKRLKNIVGRDTQELSPQQIRTAALETLSENLSDGVIAPLFWYMLLGAPGMFAYKMINTLDSMIGYKNERYKDFGFCAAKIDDIANYIPARLTSFLMIVVNGRFHLFSYVVRFGKEHASPNSGYPEAALSGILNCRFGGPNIYFGQLIEKPYIGYQERELSNIDLRTAVSTNIKAEIAMVLIVITVLFLITYYG